MGLVCELRLAYLGNNSVDEGNKALDLLVRGHDGIKHGVIVDLLSACLYHNDLLHRACNGQLKVTLLSLGSGRVDDYLAVDKSDENTRDRSVPRNIGDGKRDGCAYHTRNLVRAVGVYRHNGKVEVNVVAQVLREKRTDRTVDNAGCEDRLFGGLTLAAIVAAGDMTYGVELFLKVDRQRQKVDAGARTRGCGRVAEYGGIAVSYQAGAVCKACHLACFDYERASCKLVFKGSEILEHFVPPWKQLKFRRRHADRARRARAASNNQNVLPALCMSDITAKAAHLGISV